MNTRINFEIAKLLKEKGYPQLDAALTIAEVVMWLYEKHGVWIVVQLDLVGRWYFDTYTIENGLPNHNTYIKLERFNSPTEAYEAAILHVLNNLI